ncbi:hypothetical protein QFZ63_000410 [Streptomyces sp. B3I7]|nr:hypothetical protein [Streptomyces sp. B3I7]
MPGTSGYLAGLRPWCRLVAGPRTMVCSTHHDSP